MAVKKKTKRHKHYTGSNREADIPELAARLAPLEEHNAQAAIEAGKNNGSIIVDTGSLKIPEGLMGTEKETGGLLGLDKVIVTILLLMLAFIGFIAYLIYHMPAASAKP